MFEAERIIHPGMEVPLAFFIEVRERNGTCEVKNANDEMFSSTIHQPGIEVSLRVRCEDVPARKIELRIESEEVDDMATSIIKGRPAYDGGGSKLF